MSQLTDRLERDLREIAAAAHPSASAWESIAARLGSERASEVTLLLAPEPVRSKRPLRIAVAAAAALVVITGSVVVLSNRDPDTTDNPPDSPPPTATVAPTIPPPAAPFVGVWVSTDTDGSSQTIEIVRSSGDDYEFLYRDAFASTCSGAPATMIGTGQLETAERLVFAQPELTCDDGTIPRLGPPPQLELADFTFELDAAADEFIDPFGIVWRRAGSTDGPTEPSGVTVPGSTTATSGGMWPQSTLAEVRAAQELADAGDPDYTWQLDEVLATEPKPWAAEIFPRFIREELGWAEFVSGESISAGFTGGDGEGSYGGIVFIRCAPGQTNPLSPLFEDAPSSIRGCAPTIDQLTYETVSFAVNQPDRRGPSGIWVLQGWKLLETSANPITLWEILEPQNFGEYQVEQVIPPSDADVTALLQAFLQARVDGEGAEQYLLREPEQSWAQDREVQLLYATTSGAQYVRSEIRRLTGPVWPNGSMEYVVQLVAADGTVVEQYFHVVRHDGQLRLVYGFASVDVPTTENGQPVAIPYSLLDGEVTLAADPPWYGEFNDPTVLRFECQPGRSETGTTGCPGGRERMVIAADPLPVQEGCTNPPAAGDAEALAQSIMADPGFETIRTVPVRIAGIDALQIDGVVSSQWDTNWALCYSMWTTDAQSFRIRLYLMDHPGESAKVITIAVIALETQFERVLEQTTPIVESLEFRLG